MAKFKVTCSEVAQSGEQCSKPPVRGSDKCAIHIEGARFCNKHRSDGQPCRQLAVSGMEVCWMHGGSTPAAQKKAKEMLLEGIFPALETLNKAMRYADWPVAVRAAVALLDRAGFGPSSTVKIEDEKEKPLTELTAEELQVRLHRAWTALAERENRDKPNSTDGTVM